MNTPLNYKSASKLLFLAAGIFISVWFLHEIMQVILLLFFAIVITIVLNAPVTWLQKKKFSRTAASLIVFFGVLALFALIGWMVVPKIVTQVKLLINNLPDYLDSLDQKLDSWLGNASTSKAKTGASPASISEQLPPLINQIGAYSLTIFQNVLLTIFFFCIVIYMLISPVPLLQMYLTAFPESNREKATVAFSSASKMTVAWMWSNVVAGAIRATIVWFFLLLMGIPGIWVWAGVTFFAELIPKLGFYIMAVPPILIAFSISPMTALYVAAFYIALDELIGDFIIPRIRSRTMKIHPVLMLVMLLAMTAAFGILGAFIAAPLTAFIKAYYETFFQKESAPEDLDKNVQRMLYRK